MAGKILVADDSPSVRRFLEKSLEKGGFMVRVAQDGQEAWELLVSEFFDAVILDVNMPRKDGLSVLEDIRKDERLSGVPVIILISEDCDSEKRHADESGATACLVKSFKPTALLELVNGLFRT